MAQEHLVHSPVMREHSWGPPHGPRHELWEFRVCRICDLEDARKTDGTTDWEVSTPCIEPVPDRIGYRALKAELKRNDVRERPLVVGAPGRWHVGFSLGGTDWHHYPSLPASTMEEGFALLLRWIRAREYDITRYGPFTEALEHATACAARGAD